MGAIYGAEPDDVYWAASDIGWVVGHSYIVYGPLLQGCTTVLYEGKPVGTPDAGAFWRVSIAANGIGLERLPVRPGSSANAVPGYDLRVLDEHGNRGPRGKSARSA